MNLPRVYMCAPPRTLLPPPSPYHPLGHPSALAPSIQYPASNLDWQLVSYMIFYISILAVLGCIPTNSVRDFFFFFFSTPSPAFIVCRFFDGSHSDQCNLIFHCGFYQLWKILKEMGIPDHLNCLLRNLYADQEATVRTGHGTTDWFQIGKGVC